jgi:hypothetical protein
MNEILTAYPELRDATTVTNGITTLTESGWA